MFQKLAQLQTHCPAPGSPRDQLSDQEWNSRFRDLGTRLPQELVQLNRCYGTGHFVSSASPSNGSFGVYSDAVSSYAITRLAELRQKKMKRKNTFPVALYFEPGGLLPVGWVGSGIDLCLRTEGDNPDKWRVSLLVATTNRVDHLSLSLLDVVLALVGGELQSDVFPAALPSKKGYAFESCGESVKVWHAG